jgi:hypothetical protein
MGPLNTSTDQRDPEAVSTRRKSSRLIAPLLLLASLLLTVLHANWGYPPVFSPFLFFAFGFLVLSIVWGILASQRIFVCVVVATMAGLVGLGILLRLPHGPRREPAAVANLRTINTAQVTYLSSSGGRYGSIADLIAAGLLDDTFTGIKAGYKYYIMLNATGSGYTADALPVSTNTVRSGYYSHPDAVVRYSTNALLAPAGQSGRSVLE